MKQLKDSEYFFEFQPLNLDMAVRIGLLTL